MSTVNEQIESLPALREPVQTPERLSHLAYVTHDVEATVNFYVDIMQMPLCEAVMHDTVPSTGDPWPYIHLFFRMKDGSTIAFFEVTGGLPPRAAVSHPAYSTFDHLALEVPTTADVDRWKEWLESKGVEVLGPVNHSIIYSVYFRDPNGTRMEITTPTVPDWNDRPEEAQRIVDLWIGGKAQAAASGQEAVDVLRDIVRTNDNRH